MSTRTHGHHVLVHALGSCQRLLHTVRAHVVLPPHATIPIVLLQVILFLLGISGSGGEGEDDPMSGFTPPSRSQAGSGSGSGNSSSSGGGSRTSAPAPAPAPAPADEDMSEEAAAKRAAKREAGKRKEEGNAAYKARDFERALECYNAAYALDSEDISYLLNSAAAYFEQAKYDECIATCKAALARGDEIMAPYAQKAKAWARIGNAYSKQGDLPAAIEAFDNSLLESHTEDVHDKLKKAKAELKKRTEAEYINPALAVEAKERGNDLFKKGDFAGAIGEYTEAIKRDPTNPVYYTNRATARNKVLDLSGALEDCEKSIKLDPKYAKAHVRKGGLQRAMKEFHKSMESYQHALELEPDNSEAKDGLRLTMGEINKVWFSWRQQ